MLNQRIIDLRKLHGLTQSDLAKRIHISASAVSSYERGRRSPDLSILVALAQEFDVTTDYLLTGVPHSERDVATAKEVLINKMKNADFIHNVLQYNRRDNEEMLDLLMLSIVIERSQTAI